MSYNFSVFKDFITEVVIAEVGIRKSVFYSNNAFGSIHCFEKNVLIYFFYFKGTGMRCAVRPNQSVVVEVFVVGVILATHITTISPVFPTCNVCHLKALVDPVPDKSTLHVFTAVNNIPVFLKVAAAVPHGMSILTHNKRTFYIFTFSILFHITNARIHRTNNVGILFFASLLELNQPGIVAFFYPFVSLLKDIAITGFVS